MAVEHVTVMDNAYVNVIQWTMNVCEFSYETSQLNPQAYTIKSKWWNGNQILCFWNSKEEEYHL
jgi:hypothetical protein